MTRAQPDGRLRALAADEQESPIAVILTALPVESQAVRTYLTDVETLVHPSGTRAERGRLDGTSWYVALAEIGEGTLTAAVLTERLHNWLRPQALLFVGVAGGLKDDIKVGDVVVATKVYGIHGGKQTPEGFLVRPEAWRSSHRLEQAARHALRGKAHFKPIAVGDVVLADAESAIARHLHEHYNDAVAIEMEGAGVAQAAHLTGTLDALIIRGISDKADAHKHERDAEGSQPKAAKNAARAAVALLQELEPAPDPRLTPYLQAVLRAAIAHPYPGLVGAVPPSLTDVYMRQQATSKTSTGHDGPEGATSPRSATVLKPAEEVFRTGSSITVLLAPAGCGKSTLLRTHRADSAGRWLDKESDASVPVLVNAGVLTTVDPLPVALAKAATGELTPFGLLDELAADLFRHPPRPRTPWLVLIDGLDEIPDTDTRRAVMQAIMETAAAHPALYQFVVATRPLPTGDLDMLGPTVPGFEIQPFTPDDLRNYARSWFHALDDPDRHAETFTMLLSRSGLDALARTPLMAFMLCQLYASHPGRQLPRGRSGVYADFVALLYDRNSHKGVSRTQHEAVLRLVDRHQIPDQRRTTEAAAVRTREHLPEIIDHLAHEMLHGHTNPAVDMLTSHPQAARPGPVTEPDWHRFLSDLLRPTGLLTHRADGFHFLHQTLLEFLAARHATRDEHARAQLLGTLAAHQAAVGGGIAVPPGISESYFGFLLDRLLMSEDHTDATMAYLKRLTRKRDVNTCKLLLDQLRLGTNLPPTLTAVRLLRSTKDPGISGYLQVQSARSLAEIPGHEDEGAAALLRLVNTPGFDDWPGRQFGAWAMFPTVVSDERPLGPDSYNRLLAAQFLAAVPGHEAEGAAALQRIAFYAGFLREIKAQAALSLARVRGHEAAAATALRLFVNYAGPDSGTRVNVAESLAALPGHEAEGAAALLRLINDPNLDDWQKARTAKSLAAVRRLMGSAGDGMSDKGSPNEHM